MGGGGNMVAVRVTAAVERAIGADPGFSRFAAECLARFAAECLARFVRGDWGELCADDRRANRAADQTGGQVVGNYPLPPALAHHRQPQDATAALWVVKDGGTGALAVLFPGDY